MGTATVPDAQPPSNPAGFGPPGFQPPPVEAQHDVSAGHPSNAIQQPIGPAALEGTQIIARVGPEIILAGDILAAVNSIMEANRDRIPETAWDRQRLIIMQQLLKRMIDSKLVVVDALRNIPADNLPQIEKQVNDQFDKSRVKQLMEDAKVNNLAELAVILRKNGSSIELQRRSFFEHSMTSQWIRQKTGDDEAVSHDAMLEYYNEHIADYEIVAKARWEQLTARLDKHGTRAEARQAIVAMGNDVLVRGTPLADVARKRSQGTTASNGGARDWTTKGTLVSTELDRAIFSLPLNKLSTILEDQTGFHIVRVVERVEAGRKPFRNAQVEIEEQIKLDRRKSNLEEYFSKLRDEIHVWTIFDAETK